VKLLIVDFETTGIGADAVPLELAATLYQVGDVAGAIASVSTLIPVDGNPAQAVNGIDPRLSQMIDPEPFVRVAEMMAGWADYPMAFNADFDRGFMESLIPSVKGRTWLCARNDFDWLPGWTARPRSQIDLALAMGIGVIHAHRAGDDVRTLAACLDRLGDRLVPVVTGAIERSQSPQMVLLAQVSYDDRQQARSAGFWWDGDRRRWVRTVRLCDLQSDWVQALPFPVETCHDL
jgi:DNA polymerase III subunit epsilon